MKLWIDDKQSAPSGYTWCRRIEEAKDYVSRCLMFSLMDIEVIDICKEFCESFICWMREIGFKPNEIRIHSKYNASEE